MRADGSEDQDVLNLRCSEASLPGSNLATLETTNTYHGVTERHAYRRVYDDRIDLTFYVDAEKYLAIRFFESWINGIMLQDTDNGKSPIDSTYTYRARYSEDYVSPQGLKVRKFERDFDRTGSVLEYTFVNSYPFSISAMPVSYESSSLLKCTVSFSYLRYVLNELKDTSAFGSRQTPALNKQLLESFADQAAFKEEFDVFTRDKALWKPEQIKEKEDALGKKQAELQAAQMEIQQEFYAAQNEAFQKIFEQVKTVVDTVSKEKGYSLVLSSSQVVSFPSANDITESVAEKLEG